MISRDSLIKRFKKLQGIDALANMFITDVIKEIKKEPEADPWIMCSDRMPEEHDSIFAKVKGTDKWKAGMFEKLSDDVIVSVEFKDGTSMTKVSHTLDGKWKIEREMKCYEPKVIAWQPLPEPYDLNLRRNKYGM